MVPVTQASASMSGRQLASEDYWLHLKFGVTVLNLNSGRLETTQAIGEPRRPSHRVLNFKNLGHCQWLASETTVTGTQAICEPRRPSR